VHELIRAMLLLGYVFILISRLQGAPFGVLIVGSLPPVDFVDCHLLALDQSQRMDRWYLDR